MSAASFPEEDLSLTADKGSGFFPARPGLPLKNGNYTIIRKLGRGQYSSTWLVVSSQLRSWGLKYHAVKILTADATRAHHEGILCELEILKDIRDSGDDKDHLPILRDDFMESGLHGDHLCLVMDVLSTDVVAALAQLHSLHIINTDLKLDNVLFNVPCDDASIEACLSKSGPSAIDGEFDLEGQQLPIVRSQPIPHGFHWDQSPSATESLSVTLTDFRSAQWANKAPTVEEITPYGLRAPEVILRATFDTKVDIWAVGCLTFELITGHWLFSPEGGEGWLREDDHFAKIMEVTGENFSTALLERSQCRTHYFDHAGNLLRIDRLYPVALEMAIANYNVLSTDDIAPVAEFIRACIRIDPAERASATELQRHNWLASAFTSSGR